MADERLRERWRKARARYRQKHVDRCSRCARPRDARGRYCALCLAETHEKRLPEMQHDPIEHARVILLAREPDSRCAVTGFTLTQLELAGMALEVDRVRSDLGYTGGNLQLLTSRLNASKGRGREPAWWVVDAVRALVRMAERNGGG